jgi:cob(I)alamin adenosyltransferase
MHADEYRFFITHIQTLAAENTVLKRVLSEERASFDVFVTGAEAAMFARLEERKAADKAIKELEDRISALQRRKRLPGVIGGAGVRHGGVEAVIGLGWKIELF